MKVGLTGGIGSGKSTVARIFNVLGIPVYDADAAAKRLMETDAALRAGIVQLFGDAAYEQGRLNRPYIANIVFNQPEQLAALNALVHPATIRDADAWAAQQTAAYTIKEAALMFESESFHHLHAVIGVTAPLPLRIRRVMQRDNTTAEAIKARISQQLSDSLKMKLCDYVIVNDEQQLLIPQVLKVHEALLQQVQAK
jgi:dephospho-CoA kinase